VVRIGPKTFVGIQEIYNNTMFMEGTLLVDDDETVLCYVDKVRILHAFSDREL